MKAFMDKDFLLSTETAKKLYHEYAEVMPIIDYHWGSLDLIGKVRSRGRTKECNRKLPYDGEVKARQCCPVCPKSGRL